MSGYAAVLKDRFGKKPTRIDENFYSVDGRIYCICAKGTFVICPAGFNRSKPERFQEHLIWTMECDDPKSTLKQQIHALKIRETDLPRIRRVRTDEAA